MTYSGNDRFAFVEGCVVVGEVWKDLKRFGWRGKCGCVEWFFMPDVDSVLAAVQRELEARRG